MDTLARSVPEPGQRGVMKAPEPPPTPRGAPVGRRVVLGMLGVGAAAVAAGPALQDVAAGLRSTFAPISGTNEFRYYSVTGSVTPHDAAMYRLSVGGLVDRPATLTLGELEELPQTRVVHDVVCTDGWRVDHVPFDGVLLRDLLDTVGLRPDAAAVRFTCFDGVYTEGLTLEQARRYDIVIALRMLDAPIEHDAGGPVRLFVAPMYFYKSAKWLSGIEVTDAVRPGYWEQTGWPIDAWLPGEGPRDA